MHRRILALSSTFVGTFILAGSAFAQTAPSSSTPAVCPIGCRPVTAAAPRVLSPAERARREEARQARLAAEAQRAQQLAQLQHDHDTLAQTEADLARERAAHEQAERDLAAARTEDEQAELRLNDAQRARFEAEQRTALLTRPHRGFFQRARGGGPHGYHPLISFAVDAGAGAFAEDGVFGFGNGIGAATYAGPSWGARVGVEFFPWLAVEGRYFGMYNNGVDRYTASGAGLLTNGTAPVLRLTLPTRFVQPYIFGGVGYYWTSVTGSAAARQSSQLVDSSNLGLPVGIGLNVPITRHLSLGAEATYHRMLGENYSNNATIPAGGGGDPWTLDGVIRWTL